LFDVEGHVWLVVGASLRPVSFSTETVHRVRLRRLDKAESRQVRQALQDAATEAWALITG
jgi:heme exporter protein D